MGQSVETRMRMAVVFWVAATFFFIWGTAAGAFEPAGWKHFRQIRIPADFDRGHVVIPLEAAILEKCRPDLGDVRVVSSNGEVVPVKFEVPVPKSTSRPFPAEMYRIARRPEKWTDIWIDKSGKIITRGVLIQTSSEDFVRVVEIRGSDRDGENFVIRMDGLIASRQRPVPFRSLKIEHSLNNFQYLHLRILDDGDPPLTIESVLCYPPAAKPTGLVSLHARIMENRIDPADNSTVIVADLGKDRFPLCGIGISSPSRSFVSRVRVLGSSSTAAGNWREIYGGTFFRIEKSGVVKENLEARFKPEPFRFIMVKLSGTEASPVEVDGIDALAAVTRAVFPYRKGRDYRLFYGNPLVRRPVSETIPAAMDHTATDDISTGVVLGKEEENAVPVQSNETRTVGESKRTRDTTRLMGLIILLSALSVLFALLLTFRRMARPRQPRRKNV